MLLIWLKIVFRLFQTIAENPKLRLRFLQKIDMVKITVEDNGVGISEDNKDKIFEPKFTTKTSGMGLGLAMVKNIVETYNGNITFTSQARKRHYFYSYLSKS